MSFSQVMQKLRLVPLGIEAVEERVTAFRQYNDEVGKWRRKKNCLGSQLLHLNVFSSVNYSYQSCLKLLSMNIPPVPWHPLSFNHMLDKRLKLLFLNWVISVLVNCFRVDFSFAMIFAYSWFFLDVWSNNCVHLLFEQIRRNLPDVLLATMNILYTKYRNAR